MLGPIVIVIEWPYYKGGLVIIMAILRNGGVVIINDQNPEHK